MSFSSSASPQSQPTLVPDDTTFTSSSSSQSSSNSSPYPYSYPQQQPQPQQPTTISISTAFHFEDADLIILSSDSVFFSVHARTVRASSTVLAQLIDALKASNPTNPIPSQFSSSQMQQCGQSPDSAAAEAMYITPPSPESHPSSPMQDASPLPPSSSQLHAQLQQQLQQQQQPLILPLPEPSTVLNVLLHLLYQLPCTHFYPDLATLHGVMSCLTSYAIPHPPSAFLSHSLMALLAPHAPLSPLHTYALASSASFEPLAVLASRHCLHIPLSDISEPLAALMGPLYLRRLLFLHLGRIEALKRILSPAPKMHSPTLSTADCDVSDQKRITKAWALATAYLACSARADMSEAEMRGVLEPLAQKVECGGCRGCLRDRIELLCEDWRAIKDTI